MKLEYYNGNNLSTVIDVDYKTEKVKIKNFTDDMIERAFGSNEYPTFKDFNLFLEERCFPRTRDKMKLILDQMDLQCYDPLEIIKKTEGRMAEDNMWIKILEK